MKNTLTSTCIGVSSSNVQVLNKPAYGQFSFDCNVKVWVWSPFTDPKAQKLSPPPTDSTVTTSSQDTTASTPNNVPSAGYWELPSITVQRFAVIGWLPSISTMPVLST